MPLLVFAPILSTVMGIMNPHYRELADSIIRHALERSQSAALLKHLGLRGRARETFAMSMLTPFLDPSLGICTGVIVDSLGNSSSQIDIIIYDKRLIPSIMFSVSEGIVPVESVLAAVEVKSRLTPSEISGAIRNARSVKALQPDFREIYDGSGDSAMNPVGGKLSVPCFLYAFSSSVTSSKMEEARILKAIEKENRESKQKVFIPLTATCVANQAVYFGGTDSIRNPTRSEIQRREDQAALRFLTCLVDVVTAVLCQRRRMSTSHYFIDEH